MIGLKCLLQPRPAFHIEGFRIDIGGIRISFHIRGGMVRDTVCTLPSAMRASSFDWKRGQRIGEAGKPGPPWERGGIYFGRFTGDPILHVGVIIKRIGETQADYLVRICLHDSNALVATGRLRSSRTRRLLHL